MMPRIVDLRFARLTILGYVGWNGLIGARTYLQLAPSTNLIILDDGNSIGGVWSKEKIYPNLYAQVGYGMFEYSFRPMKKENVTQDRYISGETVHHYLNDFARENDLIRRMRLNTRVDGVEKLSIGGWQFMRRTWRSHYLSEADVRIWTYLSSCDPSVAEKRLQSACHSLF